MLKIAVERAQEKLDQAKAHMAGLKSTSKDYQTVRDNWSGLLYASNRVFSLLEQGAKASPGSIAWFAKHRELRKSDPLLQYVHQARNADEHGLAHITRRMPPRLELVAGGKIKASLDNLATDSKGQTIGTFQNLGADELRSEELTEIRIHPEQPVLVAVISRGVSYEPPAMHLGKPIEYPYPQEVANLILQYLEHMLDDAQKLASGS